MEENILIRKSKRDDEWCYEFVIQIEKISNGWLATKTIEKYPNYEKMDHEAKEPMPEPRNSEHKVTKKYFKQNPLEKNPVWEKADF